MPDPSPEPELDVAAAIPEPDERRGWVRCPVLPAQITDAGLDALRRATEVHLDSLQRHLVDPLGPDGLEALTAPLRRLRDTHIGDPAR